MTTGNPQLGILHGDAPTAHMVVVAFTASDNVRKWAYAGMGHPFHPRSYPLEQDDSFTPLNHFGAHATMTNDGHLAVHQLGLISIARGFEGKARHWQGAPSAKIILNPKFGGYVAEAIRLDFEHRRDATTASQETPATQ